MECLMITSPFALCDVAPSMPQLRMLLGDALWWRDLDLSQSWRGGKSKGAVTEREKGGLALTPRS